MHLYEISKQYNEIQTLADSDDESMILAVKDTLEAIGGEFEEKAKAVVSVALNITSDIEAIDAQIKRLQEKKKTIQSKDEWLRNYLKQNMQATGINKITCPLFSITLSAPASVVAIDDESALPDDYVKVKTDVSPDKVKIARDLKAGISVPGASLVDGERRLTIR